MKTTVIGGAMLPHAPQFFTQPDTEPQEIIAAVKRVGAEIGEKLHALNPDLWIIFSNDHAEQFFHTSAPPFTIHVGGRATGDFAGHKFDWEVPSEIGFELVRRLYQEGYDPAFTSTANIDYAIGIPLTHLGVTAPVLPIYVNAYLPPQPTMERCYAFGRAVGRAVSAMGLRTVVVSSGGMSHFPGTDRYSSPELDWDLKAVERLGVGNLKSLIGYDEVELDDTGNIELRCWACGAGALGERKPDILQVDPSWHHNYISLGWHTEPAAAGEVHYPAIKPELVNLTAALHSLAHDNARRVAYLENPQAYAAELPIPEDQRGLLAAMDLPGLTAAGVHPLVPFLADMHLRRMRKASQG